MISNADAHNAHLTEDQFTDCVLGLTTAEVEAHVAQCSPCHAEVESLKSSIAAFSDAGRRWSEMQRVPTVDSIRRRALWQNMRPIAGFAMSVVAVISIAIPVGRSQREATHAAELQQTVAETENTAPIANAVSADDAPVMVAVAQKPVHTVRLIAASLPTVAESDTLQQDNAMMSAISAEIASPVAGSIQSVVTSVSGQ